MHCMGNGVVVAMVIVLETMLTTILYVQQQNADLHGNLGSRLD